MLTIITYCYVNNYTTLMLTIIRHMINYYMTNAGQVVLHPRCLQDTNLLIELITKLKPIQHNYKITKEK